MTGTLHKDRCKFRISRSVILRMRHGSDKTVEKTKHTFYIPQLFPENRAVHEIMWKNIVESGRPLIKTWRMRIACWIPNDTNTHSQYEILITFPLQQC